MNIVYNGIEFLASFVEVFVLYKIYSILLYKQRGKQNFILDRELAIIGTVLIQICNHVSIFSYFTIILFVLYMSITAKIIYRRKYIELFSIASFYVLCLSCFDFLIFTLVSNFYGGYDTFTALVSTRGILRVVMSCVIKFLWILLYFMIKKYLYSFSLKKNYVYTILIISCAGFLGFVYLVNQTLKAFNYTMAGVWFVFIALWSLLFFTVYFVIESKEEKMKLDFAEMRNELLEENYKTINEIYTGNAKLYHDLNNHLNVLYQLLDEEKTLEAKNYITEISRPIMQLSKTTWTGIDVVDVVISSKLGKMKEKGITCNVNVEFPQNTNIKPHDMCTILANLLDNAIEASEKLKIPGNISLTIRRINHFLLIKVSNACEENKESFAHFPSTTKKNREFHGWGLPSVKDAVEKYNGTLKCINEEKQFIVKIMLFFEKNTN